MTDAGEDERELDGDEPAAELRALYGRLRPPPPADELSAADPETARVVGWMQGAWRGLAVPPLPVPRGVLRPQRAAARSARRALAAAAAALLVLAGAAFLRGVLRREEMPPERVAQAPAERAREVEVLAVLPDRLELRSGPVRLVLLDPPNPAITPDTSKE